MDDLDEFLSSHMIYSYDILDFAHGSAFTHTAHGTLTNNVAFY